MFTRRQRIRYLGNKSGKLVDNYDQLAEPRGRLGFRAQEDLCVPLPKAFSRYRSSRAVKSERDRQGED